MAKVNILMNCYNGAHFLADSLGSVAAQTFDDYEVVFIDNCSTDNTEEVAKSFGPKIRYYKTPRFMSLCEARVWGMQFVNCEYFSMLDVDDMILPTKLEEQVRVLDTHPEVGIVYANSVFFSDKGEEFLLYKETMPSGNIFKKMLSNYFLSLETLMARKSVMDKFGLSINPKYNIISDAELYIKLSYYADAYYIDKPLAKWRMGTASESSKQFESFPREYEILISDLEQMIPDFRQTYSSELRNLEGIIQNMSGLASWKKGHLKEARSKLKTAFQIKKSYFVPYFFSFFVSFEFYMKLRRGLKRY